MFFISMFICNLKFENKIIKAITYAWTVVVKSTSRIYMVPAHKELTSGEYHAGVDFH